MSLRDDIARRLTQAREAATLERKDAAEAMGIPYQTYAAHENGNRTFDVETAVTYARKFKVSLDWLLTGHGRGPGGEMSEPKITDEPQILAMLARIEGLTDTDINVAFGVIRLALAKQAGSGQSEQNDPPAPATRRREEVPSQ
ncbi:helix-turn-helix domain-containing protein [Aquamicrobium terrae]